VKLKTPARTFEDDPATAPAQVSNQVTASFEITASFAWTQIPLQIIFAQIPKLVIVLAILQQSSRLSRRAALLTEDKRPIPPLNASRLASICTIA
jgi:hypothetical protein